MFILKIILELVASNIRPLIIAATVLFSVSGIYYGVATHFERRASIKIIQNQARELETHRNRCNRFTTTYLLNNEKLNEELDDARHKINNNKKMATWSEQRLPASVERMLNE